YRMQAAVRPFQVFDGDNMAAVERGEEADAGIDALIDEVAAGKPADEHGAGAAVAFCAPFLRAGQTALETQIVEQRAVRPHVGEGDPGAVQEEADFAADGGHQLPR